MAKEEKLAAPAMTPSEWAKAKAVEDWIFAATAHTKGWDREPLIAVSEIDFDRAIAAVKGISLS